MLTQSANALPPIPSTPAGIVVIFKLEQPLKTLEPISRIILQTPAKFEETVSQGFREVSKFPHYGIDDAVASTENKYTKYAKTCSILGMSNGIESYVGHFAIPANLSNFLKNLDIIIKI